MRSLIVSDLHLGAASGGDILRQARPRETLLEEVTRADQLVLLGDVVELRGMPVHDALERARPVLAEIGEAAGDARVVVVPGNHDHRLAAEWIERRRQRGAATPLRPVETWRPGRSGIAGRVARALGSDEVMMAYPGIWIRPDVWATHGHYLDCHSSVPAIEVLAVAAVGRLTGGLPAGRLSPDAYESVVAPVYAFNYEVAQNAKEGRRTIGPGGSVRLWRRLAARDGRPSLSQLMLGGVVLPGAVAAVNRAGLGPFSRDLSPRAVRQAAVRAMGTTVDRLGIDAPHVVFGHTHRAGPLPRDRDRAVWSMPGGRSLWNSGSWVHEPTVAGPPGRRSGHWPGACVIVEGDDPPRVERLIDEQAELEAIGRAAHR